jgi:hypothetical protein
MPILNRRASSACSRSHRPRNRLRHLSPVVGETRGPDPACFVRGPAPQRRLRHARLLRLIDPPRSQGSSLDAPSDRTAGPHLGFAPGPFPCRILRGRYFSRSVSPPMPAGSCFRLNRGTRMTLQVTDRDENESRAGDRRLRRDVTRDLATRGPGVTLDPLLLGANSGDMPVVVPACRPRSTVSPTAAKALDGVTPRSRILGQGFEEGAHAAVFAGTGRHGLAAVGRHGANHAPVGGRPPE